MIKYFLKEYKGIKTLYHLSSLEWNWYLNRYYPQASKVMEIEIIAECGCNWSNLDEAKLMIKRCKELGLFAAKFQLFNKAVAPDLPKHLYLKKYQAKELFEYGKSIGQEVFFTPMFLKAVNWCEEIGVKYYKVRYKDRNNLALLERIKRTRKPVFISGHNMYCIPKYPSTTAEYIVGVSDHTPDMRLLKYLEKHVKLNNNCLESDWSVSFDDLFKL